MEAIPADIIDLYEKKLSQAKLPISSRDFYKKWLKYFLDYCRKYGHDASDPKSLSPFIKKLASKKQSPAYQRQAQHAVILYHELPKKTASKVSSAQYPTASEKPPLQVSEVEATPSPSPLPRGDIAQTASQTSAPSLTSSHYNDWR